MTGIKSSFQRAIIAALLSVMFLPTTHALRCESKPMELALDHASEVFLARILSSELIYPEGASSQTPPNGVRHRFEVSESFKGAVTYNSFETDLAWGTRSAHFAVGDVNLFFMQETPGFDSCTPKYLLGQEDTDAVLRKLGDLKKGVFNSVSGAWATTVGDGHCSIYTTYLLEGSSSTVSFSIGHSLASENASASSNVWVYSYSKTGQKTIDRSGLTLSYEKEALPIPYANSLLDNGANFYSKLSHVDDLLVAVLAQEPVYLAGSTRNDSTIKIPLLLNGGGEAIREFAHCGRLVLAGSD